MIYILLHVTIELVILVRLTIRSLFTCLFINCMLMELFTPLVKFLSRSTPFMP